MGSICQILENKFIAKRSNTSSPSQWLIDWVSGGSATSSGIHVNEGSALKYTPFWAAVRIISGTIAHLPFIVYRRLPKNEGKERKQDHPVYKLMHDRPNDYMDALTFIESRQAHVLTYGNGYAEIQRDGSGRPIALWPLLPDRTERKIKDGVPYYEVRSQVGQTAYLPEYNVLHIKGLGFDGYNGYNVVDFHREAIAYGMAVKEYGARFFGNDASPGGTLETPNGLSETAFKHLKESWLDSQKGLSNAHRMQILEEGLQFKPMGIDPAKAQALEVQKWTVDDCARIFQIPPHKLGSMEFSKYNNVEQLQLDFVATTMLYWFRKWELECDYKLFMPSERGKLFCEILVDGLLRGDITSRYAAYNIGRNAGFLSPDDIREKENMNPLPDGKGKIYLQPLNMVEAGTKPAEPPPAEPEETEDDSIRVAHRELIDSAWSRVITKKNNSGRGQNGWAEKILFGPVNAWASIIGVSAERAKSILDRFMVVNYWEDNKLENVDSKKLATLIMQEIGADNA